MAKLYIINAHWSASELDKSYTTIGKSLKKIYQPKTLVYKIAKYITSSHRNRMNLWCKYGWKSNWIETPRIQKTGAAIKHKPQKLQI